MENKMATALPGNTNTGSANKKRCFQLTLNNETSENIEECRVKLLKDYNTLKSYLLSLKYNYFISCLEKNKKGFYHIHIFIQFTTPRRLSIKKCVGAHIEYCKGSVNDNIKYIKKDNVILDEIGKPNLIIGSSRIKDIINCSDTKELLKLDYKYVNCINKIKGNDWYQPLLNREKNIYFYNTDTFKLFHTGDFKKYSYVEINEKNKFINISNNIVLQYNPIIFRLLPIYNKKIQDFHCNDIFNIVILYKDINIFRNFIKQYTPYIDEKYVKCNIYINGTNYKDLENCSVLN